jgi:hypothetical protein
MYLEDYTYCDTIHAITKYRRIPLFVTSRKSVRYDDARKRIKNVTRVNKIREKG